MYGKCEGSAKAPSSATTSQRGLLLGMLSFVNCRIPTSKPVYEFLLRQNYEMEALSFSVRGKEIVLSLVIFEQDPSLDTGMKLFRNLFEKADHYDNLLVEKYGAGWKEEFGK